MKFYNDGYVNFPFLSDGMWFLTQHRRWGLLKEDPDYLAVAKKVNQIDIYKQAAAAAKAPRAEGRRCARAKLIDGVVWDGKDPKAYAAGFKIKVAWEPEPCPLPQLPLRRLRALPPRASHRRHRRSPQRCEAAQRRARAGRERARRASRAERAAAYLAAELRRERVRAVLLVVLPPILGIALFVALWARRVDDARRSCRAGDDVRRGRASSSAIPSTARGRTTRASAGTCSPRSARGHRLRARGARRHPARLHARPLRVRRPMAAPIISLLRPVSPLAWLPIGLLVFKAANPAAIWVIFISSMWPMVINTAVGVRQVPQDYLNVARVLNLSEWKVSPRSCSRRCCPTCSPACACRSASRGW